METQMTLFGEPGGTERVGDLDALQEGDLVAHRLVPELRGRVVALQDGRARLKLLTWPSAFLRRWYGDGRLCPVLAGNLVLAE